MSTALINLYNYKQYVNKECQFKLLLSVHDSVLLEVPTTSIETVIEEALPLCMVECVEVPTINLKYKLGDIDVQLRWGEKAPPDKLLEMGVPRKYCGFE